MTHPQLTASMTRFAIQIPLFGIPIPLQYVMYSGCLGIKV